MSTKFANKLIRTINDGSSRSVILSGNVHDLFLSKKLDRYVPITHFLTNCLTNSHHEVLIYELNGPIRCSTAVRKELEVAWDRWEHPDKAKDFDAYWSGCIGKPTMALEFLRQLCLMSRSNRHFKKNLIILVESAEMMLAAGNGDVTSLSHTMAHRVGIVRDWISDHDFSEGKDTLVLLSESRSQIHSLIARLPQVTNIEVSLPGLECRQKFIEKELRSKKEDSTPNLWGSADDLANMTAGLFLHSIRQLLKQDEVKIEDVLHKIEAQAQSQLGDDVIEFKKPSHTLDDVIGFSDLKKFIKEDFITRFQNDEHNISGAAIAGAIGSGKTFIFEAVASEMGALVITLKNIRSQWFGQTDVVFEKLRQFIEPLHKVVIFVDEADTQFGKLGSDGHGTEKRLTGKIQAMMSDPKLKGKVLWLLMTARIENLSADIRRPGRAGDLIIPVLDPVNEDRRAFAEWVFKDASPGYIDKVLNHLPEEYSAAEFSALRSFVNYKSPKSIVEIRNCIDELIPSDISDERKKQNLHAKLNCTRLSLLGIRRDKLSEERESWKKQLEYLNNGQSS